MYIPRTNLEDRIPVLHKLIEDQPFASLVTMGSSSDSHVPYLDNPSMADLRWDN